MTTTARPRVEYDHEVMPGLNNIQAAQQCEGMSGNLWRFDLIDMEITNASHILDMKDLNETWTVYGLYASPWIVSIGRSTSNAA